MANFVRFSSIAILVLAGAFVNEEAIASQDYSYLQSIEPKFSEVALTEKVGGYNQKLLDISNQNEALVEQERPFRELAKDRSILDFTGLTFGQKVANMVSILQTKLDCRGGKYSTQHKKNEDLNTSDIEESADPFYTKLTVEEAVYNFTLNYAGSGKSNQPGNDSIRLSNYKTHYNGEKAQAKRKTAQEGFRRIGFSKTGVEILKKDQNTLELLLANEVARRKVVDRKANIPDAFSDLPIFCSVVMAMELLKKGRVTIEEILLPGGKYYAFGEIISEDQKDQWKAQAIAAEKRAKKMRYIVDWAPINSAVAEKELAEKRRQRTESIEALVKKYKEHCDKEGTDFKKKLGEALAENIYGLLADVTEVAKSDVEEEAGEQSRSHDDLFLVEGEIEGSQIPGIGNNIGHHTESDNSFTW